MMEVLNFFDSAPRLFGLLMVIFVIGLMLALIAEAWRGTGGKDAGSSADYSDS